MNARRNASLKNRTPLSMLALPGLMAVCTGVYISGLFGGFQFDDYPNIVNNNLLQATDGTLYHWWLAALSSNSGLLRRPISMLSFGANIYLFGMNPIAFKLVNLFIHILNGVLIYRLSLLLLPYLHSSYAAPAREDHNRTVALIAAALWILNPLHVSNVLYIVQRMNLLTALFTLLGLLCYAEGRRRSLENGGGLLVAFSGLLSFGVLATFSKENGALAIFYALVIELTCFRFRGAGTTTKRPVVAFFLMTLALPLAVFVVYLLSHAHWLFGGYAHRAFTLGERLLTEPRILIHYLQWIFLPLPQSLGLYHDDIPVSTGVFSPMTTIVSIVALLALVLVAWKVRNRTPAITFGVAWFLAGHAMESTILPLEIVFEHRNYLPMAGLLLGCVATIAPLAEDKRFSYIRMLFAVLIVIFAGLTADRSVDWGDPTRLALVTAKDHPNSPRSLYGAGRAIILAAEASGNLDDSVREKARTYFARSMALNRTYLYPATGVILTAYYHKKVPESAVDDLAFRLRSMPLFQATPFLMLLKATGNARVEMTPKEVARVVSAALENPGANQGMRAMILNDYGRYLFVAEHDAQRAVSLTLAAAEMAPENPLFQVNLTKLALALGQPAIAEAHLAKAKKWNVAGIYTRDVKELALQIKEQRDQRESKSEEVNPTTKEIPLPSSNVQRWGT